MSDDLFSVGNPFVGEATRRGLVERPKTHFGAPYKKPVRKERKHVAAPPDWREAHGDSALTVSDAEALRKAWIAACAVDFDAAMAVLSQYNTKRFSDVQRRNVDNVHFDLVMISFHPEHTTR